MSEMRKLLHPSAFDSVITPRHLDDPRFRPVRGGLGLLEPVPKSADGGDIHMWGEALVKNGDTMFRARNKVVGQGLRNFIQVALTDSTLLNTPGTTAFPNNSFTQAYIRCGTGTGATVDGTTGLTTPVATNPNTTLAGYDSPAGGTYRFKYIATWNAGTIAALTINEIGVFGNLRGTTMISSSQTALMLMARLSTTDSEFTAFLINVAAPLTIEYRLSFVFA